MYQEFGRFTQSIQQSGNHRAGKQLQPVATATTVRVRDGKRLVTDGPFAETREQLGGFYMIEAKDLDEALAIAERIPSARWGSIEVRPIVPPRGVRPNLDESGIALSRGVAARVGHHGAPDGRFRFVRGSGAGCVRGGAGTVAARWNSRQSVRVAGIHGAQSRGGSASTACALARKRNGHRAVCRVWIPSEIDLSEAAMVDDQLRLIFTCCHPALAVECASGAHAADGLRSHYRRDRARLFAAGGHHGAAPGAGEAQDPRCAPAVRNAAERPAWPNGWTA